MESKNIFNKLNNWDQKIILKYNGIGGKILTNFLKIISFLGRETLWIVLMVFYLFIWYAPFLFSNISAIFLLGVIIIAPLKKSIDRERPFETLKDINVLERKPTSRSFPSWHAYNVISQGLLFAYLLNSIAITIIVSIFAVIVSFSRIQLGVHYPSDVIFGFFIGIIGFLLAEIIVAPILLRIIVFYEQFYGGTIHYYVINPLLFENIWYLFVVIGIVTLVILFSIYKRIKEIFESIK
jgi:membrane-associated phospholipid phosphatase